MTENNQETRGGTYSRERLMYIAALWLLAGAVVFAFSPTFTAHAQDVRGCEEPPCMFPAQSNVGGIVLGTDDIVVDDLIAFGVGDTGNPTDLTAPDRVWDEEEGIRLGANGVTANDFFIYKEWSYFDPRVGEAGETVPVYIWADATEGQLTGSEECGDGNDGLSGAENCDLIAGTPEVSTAELVGEPGECDGLFFLDLCGLVPDTLEEEDFWTPEPEEDECGELGALGGDICLGLIGDGPISVFGVTVDGVDQVDALDFMIRSHNLRSVPGPDDNADKEMFLEDAYFEIRYGHGTDRINQPTSDVGGTYFAQPFSTQYGDAALANDFLCTGGGPTTFCLPDGDTVGNIDGIPYDNVHTDPVDSVDD